MATQPPIDPMREQYFHKVLELVNQNEMAANKIFSILSTSPDSLDLFTSPNRLVNRVQELVVTLRLDVGVVKQNNAGTGGKNNSNKSGAKLLGLQSDGPITNTPSGIPTTPIVAGKGMRFNNLFKQVEDVAFRLCEDKNVATSVAKQLCNAKDTIGLEGMFTNRKALQTSIEKTYKEQVSDSFLKRITEISGASKAPGLLKIIMGLPIDQLSVAGVKIPDKPVKNATKILNIHNARNSCISFRPLSLQQKQLGAKNFSQIKNKKEHSTPINPQTAHEAPIVSCIGSPTADNITPPTLETK